MLDQALNTTDHWTEDLAKDLKDFLSGRIRCPEVASELTHETYLRFYQTASQLPPENARALAFRIAVNLAIDYQRRSQVKQRFISEDILDKYTENLAGSLVYEPTTIISGQQRLARLKSALDDLPLESRTVFILHALEGLSYNEVAERMHISRSKVGRLLAHALEFCAERVDG